MGVTVTKSNSDYPHRVFTGDSEQDGLLRARDYALHIPNIKITEIELTNKNEFSDTNFYIEMISSCLEKKAVILKGLENWDHHKTHEVLTSIEEYIAIETKSVFIFAGSHALIPKIEQIKPDFWNNIGPFMNIETDNMRISKAMLDANRACTNGLNHDIKTKKIQLRTNGK